MYFAKKTFHIKLQKYYKNNSNLQAIFGISPLFCRPMECPHLEKAVQIDVAVLERLQRDLQLWTCSGSTMSMPVNSRMQILSVLPSFSPRGTLIVNMFFHFVLCRMQNDKKPVGVFKMRRCKLRKVW